jgi:Uma2 family endonuclease
MAVAVENKTKRWTYEEYYRLDDDQRYEIIDGELLMAPAPDVWHQDWSRDLFRVIDGFVRSRKLGKVFYAPTDVVLSSENTVQPDLIFVSNANLGISSAARFSARLICLWKSFLREVVGGTVT